MSSGWRPVAAAKFFEQIAQWGLALPHCHALGLQLCESSHGQVTLALPFKPEWIGNSQTRILHGGLATTMADTAGAFAIYTLLTELESIVTLDLRIDYLRPGLADLPLYCQSECYRLTNQIAFTRSILYQQDRAAPVGHAVATYMRSALPAMGGGDHAGH